MNNGNMSLALTLGVEALLCWATASPPLLQPAGKAQNREMHKGVWKKNRIIVQSMDKPYTDIGNFK